ncbi:energy-coupling factor ABC transporter permease [Chitinibacter tainanensis]|uniref:energy-coupling factor ABC transporter permease n=1 Tax=Chitinibacter tainanensis TaxID=230667 RepID=UPI000421B109|nr:energy-coupling factor ABC transporter permease [Chitinibacter tainanensis]
METPLYADSWLTLGWFCLAWGCVVALRREAWRAIPQGQLTGWLAACVLILLSWQLKAEIQSGIAFHILGSAALMLIAGPWRALLGMAVLFSLQGLYGHIPLERIGIIWTLKALIPISLTALLLHWTQLKLPLNYFVYIFINCFAAAALSMWAFGISHTLVLATSGSYAASFLLEEILPYYFLMGWPEGFITGLNLTLLVVWQPQLISTFDDRKYLQKRD